MKTILGLALAFFVVGVSAARADGEHEDWAINVVVENDKVDAGHDRNYTSGVMVAATSPRLDLDHNGRLWRATKWFTGINDDVGLEVRQEYSLSSLMFTPQDLQRATPDPLDRPFAGLLLGSFGLIASDDNAELHIPDLSFVERSMRLDTLALTIGTIGSASRADDLQTWLHDEIDGVNPTGWANQIPSRVLANVSFQRSYGIALKDAPIDVFAHWGAALGSIQTNGSVGLSARIGINRPNDFGLPRIAPSVPSSGYFEPRDERRSGAYLFAGVQQRYVLYDVTLDEGPANRAATIDSNDWVSDAQIGVVGFIGPFHVGYTRVWRGRQFRSQPHEDSFDSWAIGLRTCLCRSVQFPPPWH